MDQLRPFSFAHSSSADATQQTNTTLLDRPSFTFIDHADDLASKRIKDVNARKAIRSHVMRDVRRRERLAGMKRTSRRENRGQPEETKDQDNVLEHSKDSKQLVLRVPSEYGDPSSILEAELQGGFVRKYYRGRPIRCTATSPSTSHLNPNPQTLPTSWFFDPFCSLPGANELPNMVAHLVYYWKSVFVPVTFPNELKDQGTNEVDLLVRSSFSDPGSFFGLMSMCAAHRAALAVHHLDVEYDPHRKGNGANGRDLDYCIMKAKCIREMNAKVRDPKQALSDEAFDTIVNLLTGSLIAGLFDEARIHLTGLKRMVELRGGITDESIRSASMLTAIITADVKAASGLLVKPVFPLTWDAKPIPKEIQRRIRPPPSSSLHQLGSGFSANDLLSPPLIRILNVIRDVIFYGIANTLPSTIEPSDHHFFRILNCESEHQLLSYVFTDSVKDSDPKIQEKYTHPIETVTRVAAICFLNNFLIVSPSSSGLGRALTKHLMKAVSNFKMSRLQQISKENFGLFAWALFVGAGGSVGQAERPWFVKRLAHVAMICEWHSWEQVSKVLADYFYVPVSHNEEWKSVWEEAALEHVISRDGV